MSQVDLLLRPLDVGDFVIHGGRLAVFRIERFTAKMVVCKRVDGKRQTNPSHFYAKELIKVPEQDVMLWLLKTG